MDRVLFWAPHYKKDIEDCYPEKVSKVSERSEFHEKQLRELHLFNLEKRRVRRDLITLCNYLRLWQDKTQLGHICNPDDRRGWVTLHKMVKIVPIWTEESKDFKDFGTVVNEYENRYVN
ncbi:hypothetical protein DUI87_03959 [Hirundo rustica rustica]|uniref:Uncharacterized protein n=1 Tax=Hirundo rustica rustica TaxID=333673 RepID=A0A3M0L8M9_HIRRU|nr:hypothetical protein DUI87_03959 [Hirundo rustica rustica]